MRANDEVTKDYIEELEADNFNLRVENEELTQENISLKAELERMKKDREFCV
jgi:predicted RNase H-like nuclease (RuvC/YqgF family)